MTTIHGDYVGNTLIFSPYIAHIFSVPHKETSTAPPARKGSGKRFQRSKFRRRGWEGERKEWRRRRRLRYTQQVVTLHLRESGRGRSFVRSFNIRNGVRRSLSWVTSVSWFPVRGRRLMMGKIPKAVNRRMRYFRESTAAAAIVITEVGSGRCRMSRCDRCRCVHGHPSRRSAPVLPSDSASKEQCHQAICSRPFPRPLGGWVIGGGKQTQPH